MTCASWAWPPLTRPMAPAALTEEALSKSILELAPSFTSPAVLFTAELVAFRLTPWRVMSPEAVTGALVRLIAPAPRMVTAPWATLTGPVIARSPVTCVRNKDPVALSVVPANVVVAWDLR